ncbi:M20 family metallopeptidase [Candidatus Hepatincolaceae symbiont of Richtersius coronifer]
MNEKQFLKDLQELVNIDCGTYTPKGVNLVVDKLIKHFTQMQYFTKRIELSKEVGPLLIAYNKKDADCYDAIIIGHTDTVYQEGTVKDHKMEVKDNKAYGLGTIDMKAGLLLAIYAVKTLPQDLQDLSLCFIFNPDEEISSIYSEQEILKLAKKSKCALVVEAPETEGYIVTKRKGIARFVVSFTGKAAHASVPSHGASAIMELANFILRLKVFNNDKLNTTFNVSPIKGGTAVNVVAENAYLEFEIRFLSDKEYQTMYNKIRDFENTPITEGVKIVISQLSFKPALNNSEENQWIEEIGLAAGKKLGMPLEKLTSSGGSDGNSISYAGVPTLDGLGPIGYGWHNATLECLHINTLKPKMLLLQQILREIKERK